MERENCINDFLAAKRPSTRAEQKPRRQKSKGRKSSQRKSSFSSHEKPNLTFDEDKISNIHEANDSMSGTKRQVDAQMFLLN